MRPGELLVTLPIFLEVGLTFSLDILCMIALAFFCTSTRFRMRGGWIAYVSDFQLPYNRYRQL